MSRSAPPVVTVLMPVYNGARYLREALESILGQSFTDFEFLIVDDGSTDESVALIEGYPDARIRLVRNAANLGVVASLNRGLELARGRYLARMDADDISLPERLARQVAFMDANPRVALCGSRLEAFDGGRKTLWSPPLADEEIKSELPFESVIYHPTVMMRRAVLAELCVRYDGDYPHAEDYELWSRLSGLCRFANVGEVLLRYRLNDQSVSRREAGVQALSAGRVRRRLLEGLGLEPSAAELQLHEALSLWQIEADPRFLERAGLWLLELRRANAERGTVTRPVFDRVLARRWYRICSLATPAGLDACRCYYRSPLSTLAGVPLHHRLLFRMRALLGRS